MLRRRNFGSIRESSGGRFQARYTHEWHHFVRTFPTWEMADDWLFSIKARIDNTTDTRALEAHGLDGQRRLAWSEGSHVYYLQRPDGDIKIGVTRNLEKRMQAIRSYIPVKLLALHPGDHSVENAMHHRFADLRVHGEWFLPLKDLMTHIQETGIQGTPEEAKTPKPSQAWPKA